MWIIKLHIWVKFVSNYDGTLMLSDHTFAFLGVYVTFTAELRHDTAIFFQHFAKNTATKILLPIIMSRLKEISFGR